MSAGAGYAKFGDLGYGCVQSITVTTLVGRPPVRVCRYTLHIWPTAQCTGEPQVITCDDYPLWFQLGRHSEPDIQTLEAQCYTHALRKAIVVLPDGSSVCENPTGRYTAKHTVWVTTAALAEFEVTDLLHRMVYERTDTVMSLVKGTLEFSGRLLEATYASPEGPTPLSMTAPEGRVVLEYKSYNATQYLRDAAQHLAEVSVCPMRQLLILQDAADAEQINSGADNTGD